MVLTRVNDLLAFLGPIAAGFLGNAGVLQVAVFVMGLGTGLAGAGMLLGVWVVANMAGHAVGSMLGGMVVDTVRYLTNDPFLAYSTVFAAEAIMLLCALHLSTHLDYAASQAHQEEL